MNKFACRYAVVQFTPYSETGEFANVGVALICPQTGYFGFKLQTRRHKRITDFFEELPRSVYLRAVNGIGKELTRVARVIAEAPNLNRVAYLRDQFESLIHPREPIIRFSGARIVLTEDPAREVDRKFDHYVDRSFATPEYVEHEIEKRIKVLLGTLDLPRPFKPARVGDDAVHARFPLVQLRGGTAAKVIKPFNLNQSEPMGIYDHGGAWLQRVLRLRKRNLLPNDVLFAVKGPHEEDLKRYSAFKEICLELRAMDIVTVDEAEQESIAQFAVG